MLTLPLNLTWGHTFRKRLWLEELFVARSTQESFIFITILVECRTLWDEREQVHKPHCGQVPPDIMKRKINTCLDRNLKQIQTALLKAADPLCGLWSQILEQGMENDMDIMPAPIILERTNLSSWEVLANFSLRRDNQPLSNLWTLSWPNMARGFFEGSKESVWTILYESSSVTSQCWPSHLHG